MARPAKLLLSLFLTLPAGAHELETIRKDIQSDLERIRLVVGLDMDSAMEHRGVFVYKTPTIKPTFHVHFAKLKKTSKSEVAKDPEAPHSGSEKLWVPEFHLAFDAVSAGLQVTPQITIGLGLNYFSRAELMRLIRDHLKWPAEKISLESSLHLDYRPYDWLQSSAEVNKDLNTHHGFYGSQSSRFRIERYFVETKELLDLWLSYEVGLATLAHNLFLYGKGAQSGWANYRLAVHLEWPQLFYGVSMGNSLSYSNLFGKNRSATKINKSSGGLVGSLTLQRSFL